MDQAENQGGDERHCHHQHDRLIVPQQHPGLKAALSATSTRGTSTGTTGGVLGHHNYHQQHLNDSATDGGGSVCSANDMVPSHAAINSPRRMHQLKKEQLAEKARRRKQQRMKNKHKKKLLTPPKKKKTSSPSSDGASSSSDLSSLEGGGGGGENKTMMEKMYVSNSPFANDVKESIPVSILYGLINAAIVLPVIMSFGTIIYSDPAFNPYLPTLVKLTVISGAVHQLSFMTLSSLPFAIGQVQDAGLIFLSAMAGKIVTYCRSHDEYKNDDEYILATTTVLLPLCTAILGLALVLIGRANLASYIQLLPTPVVGGYLAFIGFFCGQNGLALMANVKVDGIMDWYKFVIDKQAFIHLLPGLGFGILIYIAVRKLRHMSVLPGCIIGLIVAFYVGLRILGKTVEDARENGWVNKSETEGAWYHTWDYLCFDKVVWGAFPQLLFTLTSMIFVVALSSSLDVAAIELELAPRPLDYNHELKTVGYSNIISGLTGGYTGSYIFSQSIFSMRAGIRTRVNGLVVALMEIITVIIPFPVLAYIPNFFFGSLLIMICVDLMVEWMWDVRTKMTRTEYGVNLASFGLIQVLGVEYGILAGLVLYVVCWKVGMDVGYLDEEDDGEEASSSDGSSTSEEGGGNLVRINGNSNGKNIGGGGGGSSRKAMCTENGSMSAFPSYGGVGGSFDDEEHAHQHRRTEALSDDDNDGRQDRGSDQHHHVSERTLLI